jgi:uncharacterized protein (TIGR02996 family)
MSLLTTADTIGGREQAAFLRAILAAPEDDVPRLIYADWLDERDDPRGEFIRVQVELAKTPLEIEGNLYSDERRHTVVGRYSEPNPKWESLRRRERELLDATEPLTERKVAYANRYLWSGMPLPVYLIASPEYRRGFVAHVTLTLAGWYGEVCRACMEPNEDVPHPNCRLCHGTGRVNAHGPALVACCPLERVTLSDGPTPIGPITGGPDKGRWFFARRDVPECLWPWFFDGHVTDHMVTTHSVSSEAAALDALSGAAIAWAKKTTT